MDLDALHAGHRRVSCSAPVKPPRYRPCGGRETGARRFSALDRRVRCVTRTGRTLRLSRRSPVGRQRQFVTIGCRRSVPKLRRSSVCTRERPLPPSPTSSTAGTKVKFQGRPVARRENCRRLLWVASSRPSKQAATTSAIDPGGKSRSQSRQSGWRKATVGKTVFETRALGGAADQAEAAPRPCNLSANQRRKQGVSE